MKLIYIVEDDDNIREIETFALKSSNYMVCSFTNAKSFYLQMRETIPDLIILDVMLPDECGYDICKKLRKDSITRRIPIIMVTAKTSEMDMVKGFDEGADDYITKPFSIMELITRVKALIRRNNQEKINQIVVGNIFMDNDRHAVFVDGEMLDLTYKEYELLKLLMSNLGIVNSREMIMQKVWETDYEGESRTIDMHIKTLRKKLGESGNYIRTIRNVGYVMENI